MATRELPWEPTLDTGGEAFAILGNARKAWIYTYLRHHPSTTIQAVVAAGDLPERTVYDYVADLEAAGLLEQSNDGRPAAYEANDLHLELVDGDAKRQITPELIEAIARRRRDEDIDVYIDRHGLDGLAVALDYTRDYVAGEITHQIMAREQDITAMEAGVILDALRPVVDG